MNIHHTPNFTFQILQQPSKNNHPKTSNFFSDLMNKNQKTPLQQPDQQQINASHTPIPPDPMRSEEHLKFLSLVSTYEELGNDSQHDQPLQPLTTPSDTSTSQPQTLSSKDIELLAPSNTRRSDRINSQHNILHLHQQNTKNDLMINHRQSHAFTPFFIKPNPAPILPIQTQLIKNQHTDILMIRNFFTKTDLSSIIQWLKAGGYQNRVQEIWLNGQQIWCQSKQGGQHGC